MAINLSTERQGTGRLADPDSRRERHAYGLRFRGVADVAELGSAPPAAASRDAPAVTVRFSRAEPPDPAPVDANGCVRLLADGRYLALDRRARTATLFGPPPSTDLLAHPYLSSIATVFSRWDGREVFHAGAFALAGRAWAVLGPRTAGKSTLMAAMAQRDRAVVTDDILVIDGTVALAGPRCVDLREPLPGRMPPTRRIRYRTRLRMALPPIDPRVPLGGWIFLSWGERLALTPIGPADLLGRLAALRLWRDLPSSPAGMLALASMPAWTLTRPRDWSAIDSTHRLLATTLAATG
jgi:hypothetical protein